MNKTGGPGGPPANRRAVGPSVGRCERGRERVGVVADDAGQIGLAAVVLLADLRQHVLVDQTHDLFFLGTAHRVHQGYPRLRHIDLGVEAAPRARELSYAPPAGRQRGIMVDDVAGLLTALKDKGLV